MTTHCRVLWLTPRSRWIDGRATFTMATSRTTMNWAAHVSARMTLLVPLRAVVTMSAPSLRVFAHPTNGESPNRHFDCFSTADLLLTSKLVKVKGLGHTVRCDTWLRAVLRSGSGAGPGGRALGPARGP